VSADARGEEFDLLHDHSGRWGEHRAISDRPTIHARHGPFTDQTRLLYRRIARRHWFGAISTSQQSMAQEPALGRVVSNGIPPTATRCAPTRTTTWCSRPGRPGEGPHLAIQAARGAGRRR
jgi:hypothetical protein